MAVRSGLSRSLRSGVGGRSAAGVCAADDDAGGGAVAGAGDFELRAICAGAESGRACGLWGIFTHLLGGSRDFLAFAHLLAGNADGTRVAHVVAAASDTAALGELLAGAGDFFAGDF